MLQFKALGNIKQNFRYLLNLGTTFLSQSITALSILIITPVLLKNLGVDGFSLYGIVLNLVGFSVIFDFGLNLGMLRKLIIEKGNTDRLLSTLFCCYLLLCAIAIPLVYIFSGEMFEAYTNHVLLVCCIVALLFTQNTVAVFFDHIIQTNNIIFVGKIIRVVKLVVEFIVLFFLSKAGAAIYLFLASICINFVYILTLYYFAYKEKKFSLFYQLFSLPVLIAHFKYSIWYFIGSIASVLVFNAQIILISLEVGTSQLSRYLLVSRFFDVIRVGLTNFTQVLFPKLVHINHNLDWILIKNLFIKMLGRIVLITTVTTVLLLWVGEPIFIFWSKQSDQEMIWCFRLFAIFIGLVVIDNVSVVFLSALKMNKIPTIVSIGQGVLGLVLGYFFLQYKGLNGVVMASLIAFVATNLFFNTSYLWYRLNKHLD